MGAWTKNAKSEKPNKNKNRNKNIPVERDRGQRGETVALVRVEVVTKEGVRGQIG